MVSEVRSALACWWYGHDWDRIRGFKNAPLDGAICKRCGHEYWRDDKDYL